MSTSSLSRRSVIGAGLAATVLTGLPGLAKAAPKPVRALSLVNLHTGEKAEGPYWEGGDYDAEALSAFDIVLRDHRTDDVHAIDPRLFDLLSRLARALHHDPVFHVISGYRSPATNAMLNQKSGGVAKKSYHMRGMAIDVRMPGVALDHLHHAAKKLRAGGVGKYVKSNFVHVDVGPVRSW